MKLTNASSSLPGRETLQTSVPPLWPFFHTKGVYKAHEASDGPPQTDRPTTDNLPGRHALMYSNREQLKSMAPMIVSLFEALCLMVNKTRSLLTPTQLIEFLGFIINSHDLRLSLPLEKIRKIQQEAVKFLQHQTLSVR